MTRYWEEIMALARKRAPHEEERPKANPDWDKDVNGKPISTDVKGFRLVKPDPPVVASHDECL